jgi:sugar phosphate isomerase/epimerase
MKLDCEGAEHEILGNTDPDVLRNVSSIAFEGHELEGDDSSNSSLDELRALLESVGFDVHFEDPDDDDSLTKALGPDHPLIFCER